MSFPMPANATTSHIEVLRHCASFDIDEEMEMTFFSNLQRIKLLHVLVWAALVSLPVARALGAQAQDATASPIEASAQGTWVATGSLNVARSGHTATLLSDGKVLVAGGVPNLDEAAYAELYDPTADTWTRTGDEVCVEVQGLELLRRIAAPHRDSAYQRQGSRCGPAVRGAVRPSHGHLDADRQHERFADRAHGKSIGGRQGSCRGRNASNWYADLTASAEIYDPITGVWTLTDALAVARSGHTSTVLRDGRVLVAGGNYLCCDGAAWLELYPLSSTEIFDPRRGTWTSAGLLVVPRAFHTASLLPSGKVLVAGGWDDGGHPRSSSEFFDSATGTSSVPGSLNVPREFAVATSLSNGNVLLTGGGSVWGIPPGNALHYENTSDAETYDTTSGKWLLAGQQMIPRMGHTATLLRDGRVLVAGGVGSGDAPARLASAELYVQPGFIGPGFTGSWYDPAQSGHGLHVEALPGNQFLAAWFTFNPVGTEQAWFLGVGTYSGTTATIDSVVQPTGGAWLPNFDPARVTNNPWGTLKFTFTDCNHGRVDFDSIRGYGSGSMNLTRLTQPAGLACP